MNLVVSLKKTSQEGAKKGSTQLQTKSWVAPTLLFLHWFVSVTTFPSSSCFHAYSSGEYALSNCLLSMPLKRCFNLSLVYEFFAHRLTEI